ncbi:MAG: hypothetical protein Q7S28_00505 [bacterium]|nr:hypothetical protein [bacterium]
MKRALWLGQTIACDEPGCRRRYTLNESHENEVHGLNSMHDENPRYYHYAFRCECNRFIIFFFQTENIAKEY